MQDKQDVIFIVDVFNYKVLTPVFFLITVQYRFLVELIDNCATSQSVVTQCSTVRLYYRKNNKKFIA